MAELTGFATGFPNGTSVVHTTPYPVKVGTRARGTDGSEYVYVNFTGTVYSRTAVTINADGTASILAAAAGARGPIGVVCAQASSDNGGWVQIYGRCLIQCGINSCSPSDAANGPTTLSTSAQTVFVVPTTANTHEGAVGYTSGNVSTGSPTIIEGMSVASDASVGNVSLTTSTATSHIGAEIAVWLNYPRAVHRNYGE
jgi:hypothetical protein